MISRSTGLGMAPPSACLLVPADETSTRGNGCDSRRFARPRSSALRPNENAPRGPLISNARRKRGVWCKSRRTFLPRQDTQSANQCKYQASLTWSFSWVSRTYLFQHRQLDRKPRGVCQRWCLIQRELESPYQACSDYLLPSEVSTLNGLPTRRSSSMIQSRLCSEITFIRSTQKRNGQDDTRNSHTDSKSVSKYDVVLQKQDHLLMVKNRMSIFPGRQAQNSPRMRWPSVADDMLQAGNPSRRA